VEIITTHKNTDFDGLASVIAATLLYPQAVGVIPKSVNSNVGRFLSTHKTAFNIILPHEVDLERVKRLIVVDTDQWSRLEVLDKLQEKNLQEIHLWDHHSGGDIEASWVCQEPMGSTITLLVREMKNRGMKLTPLDSTVLLIGLYEDTGHLSYPSTRPEDAAAAAFLLENKADLNVTSAFLNPPYEEQQRNTLFSMVKDTMTFQHRGYSIGINVIKPDRKISMLAAIVSMYRKIINADAVFVILINDTKSCTIIGRSGVERIDIGKIMKHFGGGGHSAAGSATVKTIQLDPAAIKNELIAQVQENRTSGATVADLMSFPVSSVSPETPMKQVRDMMHEQKIHGVLIIEEQKLLGIIVLWDFKKLKFTRQWHHPVKAFMIRDVTTIPPDMNPSQATKIMVDKNVGHLPVEHDGRIIGIVTRTDVLSYFYSMSG